ncbi:hypothetical protein GO013_14220 [Pseudodesulfovibrio sp. JC047]|uniref:hypothetical protein n=1 Tax=Pseudodesulfovibrio sp. JC047 TaxID=2683199 RepID=UPI0013D0AC27|nr:hypothetical protein [Pseudodesulfovibrio sp. JC047]NDV20564.1 hypothetical protein [Pseudodesulfovibrio sp. JC047]
MNEQAVIEEIRKTYSETYANAIFTMTNKMMLMEKEIEILRDGLGEVADRITPKGEDKLEWAIKTALDTLEAANGY